MTASAQTGVPVAVYLAYVDAALDRMVAIVTELGDARVNERLDVEGSNSAYVIVFHCTGVMAHWAGAVVAGNGYVRDRPAEFRASGTVDELVTRVRSAREQLERDLDGLDATAPPRGVLPPAVSDDPMFTTQGALLMHVYRELAQHLGHLEITKDQLLATPS